MSTPDGDAAGACAARCRGVERAYRSAAGLVHALRGVDCDLPVGRITAAVGPSGSGKSTLLRVLAGLDRPSAGTVEVAGVQVGTLSSRERRQLRRRRVGFVFSRPADNLVPYLTAAEHVALAAGLRAVRVPTGGSGPLAAVGLGGRAGHRPAELSGGEQLRLALAAAVVGEPALVLADEPTASLDGASARLVLVAVRALAERGATVVVASHDALVAEAADAVLTLRDGAVAP